MNNGKLLQFHGNTWNPLHEFKKWVQDCDKVLSTKCVYNSHIFNIYSETSTNKNFILRKIQYRKRTSK